jgi:hypothetical protein
MPNTPSRELAIPAEAIERKIYLVRGHKVMLDADSAELYQVRTKAFNQAVNGTEIGSRRISCSN